MSLSGSLPLSQIPPQDLNTLSLQNQERISAEVLQVAGERVYLSIDGVRVVARLTSSDQAARLLERRRANFVVKDSSPKEILLQLVGGESPGDKAGAAPINLIPELLAREGLAQDTLNTQLAQGLLNHGLPVEGELIRSLRSFLQGHHLTGERQVAAAVALLSQGLQVSPGVFALLMGDLPHLGDLLQRALKDQEPDLTNSPGPKPSSKNQAASVLEQLIIPVKGQSEQVLEELKRALPLLTDSVESGLLEMITGKTISTEGEVPGQEGTAALVDLLAQSLTGEPERQQDPILGGILDRLRLTQFANSQTEGHQEKARWLHFELPILFPEGSAGTDLKTAYLKINAPYQESEEQYHPRQVNLNFIIRLDERDVIAINLNVFEEKIQATIQASSAQLQEIAQDELEELKSHLSARGYLTQGFRCTLKENLDFPDNPLELDPESPAQHRGRTFNKINVEA